MIEKTTRETAPHTNKATATAAHDRRSQGLAPAANQVWVQHPAKGLNCLNDVQDIVRADSLDSWDTVIPRNQLAFRDGKLTFLTESGDESRLMPTNWATGQLCARLGIPAPYFRKCPSVLQDVQANYWLREHGLLDRGLREQVANDGKGKPETRWMLRAKGQTLRAVLSERYCPLDNDHLLDVLLSLLQSHFRVDWVELTEEGLHLRIVDPHRTKEVLPDDALTVGIHIANSEVGYRSVTVDALVYRLVCTNGLIRLVQGKSLLRQRHIHIDKSRLVTALQTAIAGAWDEAEGFLEQMKRTTLMPVEDVDGTIERLSERWHFSQCVQDDLLLSLRREPSSIQETVYGMVNAITNVAQRMPGEARYDMEVLAGHLAEHGVASYAPKRGKRTSTEVVAPSTEANEQPQTPLVTMPDATTFDAVDMEAADSAYGVDERMVLQRAEVLV